MLIRPFLRSLPRLGGVRKAGTLVVADNLITGNDGSTLSAISVARLLDLPVTVLVCGGEKEAGEKAKLYSRAAGVDRVLLAGGSAHEECFSEGVDRLAAAKAQENKYDKIILPHSSYGRELGPRIAALLGINQVSDVIQLSKTHCVRGMFAGNALTKINIENKSCVVTIRQSSFEPVPILPDTHKKAQIEILDTAGHEYTRKRLLGDTKSSEGGDGMVDLSSAKIVICGGRSFETKDKFQLVHQLASKLNAAVAATRAAVDSNIAPSDIQVGQTGKTIAPQLYIAFGVSGAIQHLSGITGSKIIVAVNNDPAAPIFSASDYGLVQDMFEAIPELMKELTAAVK